MYIVITILTSALNGAGGLNTTYLTSTANSGDITLKVASTAGFLSADYIVVGGDKITYTGKDNDGVTFTGLSLAKSYSSGTKVYSPNTSLLNNALGYNVGAVSSTVGLFSVVVIPIKFITQTLPNLVSGNLMPGLDGTLAVFGYIWLALTIGILMSIGIAMLWVASGIVKSATS